jgi:hypothetical protein
MSTRSSKTGKSKSNLEKAKNLVRGAIAQLHTETKATQRRGDRAPVSSKTEWQGRQSAKLQLNRALANARKSLSLSDLRQFESWTQKALPALDRDSIKLGIPLAAVGLLAPEFETRPLHLELMACATMLNEKHEQLLEFADRASTIANDICICNYSAALAKIDASIALDGYSYWAIETRLALLQLIHGIDSLKNEVQQLSISGAGLRKFLLYHFGVRNEPAQSSLRFQSSVRKRLEDSSLSTNLQTYLKFRMYGALEPRDDYLQIVLAYEQSSSTIDLLFTVVKLCNLIASQKNNFSSEVLKVASTSLVELNDILKKLHIDVLSKAGNSESLTDRLLVDSFNALFNQTNNLSVTCNDIQAVRAISSQLSTQGSILEADELSKTFANINWLPVPVGVGEVHDIPSIPELMANISNASLTNPFVESVRKALTEPSDARFLGNTLVLLKQFWHIAYLRNAGESEKLIAYLANAIRETTNGTALDAFNVIYAVALYEADELRKCIGVCAEAGRANERLIPLLPLVQLFQGKRWPTLKRLGPSVDLSISLSHAAKVIDDSKIKTFKRYSVEELMTEYGCATVALLLPKLNAEEISVEKIEFFANSVCDIPTLELLPGSGESKKVRNIRIELLRQLASLQTKSQLNYEIEAQELEDGLQVDDGLSVLDDSKVHVDEPAVLNYVNKEFEADFHRYLKLVESGVGKADSINEVLKAFDSPTARVFQIPKNDADDLLLQLVNNILDRFLTDPAAGLDIIIGRRIRHGTISGELRGALEKLDLIGVITNGKYQPPVRVTNLVANMELRQRKPVIAAIARFSESIDQLVALLRDEYFHVRSKSKTRGVFELVISAPLFALLRSLAQTCTSIEQFSKECFANFWVFLSIKLDQYKPGVEQEIKRSLKVAFQKLSTEINSHAVRDPVFLAAVQQSADELQRRASTIASWITVPRVRIEGRTYDFQQVVDVAAAVVSGQRPGFRPNIKTMLPTNIQLDSRGFHMVSDALYIVIDNVGHHSGKKVGNNMEVKIAFDELDSLLKFSITSETTLASRKPDKQSRVASIRSDIQRRVYEDRVRQDRHSGLFKLAALVTQSDKTKISFDFVEPDRFNVSFDLVYVGTNA